MMFAFVNRAPDVLHRPQLPSSPHSNPSQAVSDPSLKGEYIGVAMADSSEVLARTILEEASIGRFQLFLKGIQGGLVPETLRDKDGQCLLHMATWASSVQTVEEVLRVCPQQLNLRTASGASALMLAAAKGDLQLIRILVHAGADMSAKDDRGADCVLYAAENDKALAVLCLQWSGRDLRSVDATGCGIAHYAAYYDARNVIDLCISLSLDLHAKDLKGMTPLHRACVSNAFHSAQRLLSAGVDLSAVDLSGRTPMQVACDNHCLGIAAILTKKKPWRPRPLLFYGYVAATAGHYWAYVLPYTAHFLGLSLTCINCLFISTLLFLSLPRREPIKMHGSDLDSLRTAFQSGDLTQFCHDSEFCFKCMRRRPAKTHHCQACGHCVPGLDVHSDVFGACIAAESRCRYVFAVLALLVAVATVVYLDWAAGAWLELISFLCKGTVGARPPWSFLVSAMHVVVLWCVLWEWMLESRAVSQGLTVQEMLHKQECRYLFRVVSNEAGKTLMEYRNPYDHGRIRNWLSFLVPK